MKGFVADIEALTLANTNFRTVLYTAQHMQLVVMHLTPGQEIGEEIHEHNDQFFRVESGTGTCVIDGNSSTIKSGSGIVIPAGVKHNIINTSSNEFLKMYTFYAPPHHADGTIHLTKHDAEISHEKFDGKTTE